MTIKDYEAITDKYAEKSDLLSYWEEKLYETEKLACDIETERMARHDRESFKKTFEMLWEAREEIKEHVDELRKEVRTLEDIMATPEYKAIAEAA